MKFFLKLFFPLLLGTSLCISIFQSGVVNAQNETVDFPYEINSPNQLQGNEETTNLSDVIKQDAVAPTNGILSKLTQFFRVSGTAYNPDNTGSPVLGYVKWIVNILLGLVSLISLVLIIFAFYLIFFAKGEEAVKKATKILTGVAIALGLMGVSRLIVSYFFNVYTTVT